MKVDQATVDAVNAVMAKTGIYAMARSGGLGPPVLDADDVSALLLALAKCEPVSGLGETARKAVQLCEVCIDWNLPEVEIDGQMVDTRELQIEFDAALAAFGGGE